MFSPTTLPNIGFCFHNDTRFSPTRQTMGSFLLLSVLLKSYFVGDTETLNCGASQASGRSLPYHSSVGRDERCKQVTTNIPGTFCFTGCHCVKRPAGVVCDLEAGGQRMLPRRVGTQMPRQDTSMEARVGNHGLRCFIVPDLVVGCPKRTRGCAWLWRPCTMKISLNRKCQDVERNDRFPR